LNTGKIELNNKKDFRVMKFNDYQKFFLLFILIFGLSFCSSNDKKDNPPEQTPAKEEKPAETKEEPTKEPTSKDVKVGSRSMVDEALLNELNSKIKDSRYPDGNSIKGFEYKKWEIPNKKDFIKWVKSTGAMLKDGLEKLPGTINLEITGHADTTGPETPEGDKKGNIFYSEKRAEEVKNALVKLGFPEKRLIIKGNGASTPIPGIDETDAKNRRVTFKFIANEKASDDIGGEKKPDSTTGDK
jgi:outer membrane protein OmpA-like peptidoglycan-associated protein